MPCKREQLKALLEGLDRLQQLSSPPLAIPMTQDGNTMPIERDHVTVCLDAMEHIQRLAGQQRACRSMAELIAGHLQQQSAASGVSQSAAILPTASENRE